jgi:hypothetical protein
VFDGVSAFEAVNLAREAAELSNPSLSKDGTWFVFFLYPVPSGARKV